LTIRGHVLVRRILFAGKGAVGYTQRVEGGCPEGAQRRSAMATPSPEYQPSTALPTQDQRLRMSYKEYLAWADEDVHAEWVDGEVIVQTTPKEPHQRVVAFLLSLMGLFIQLFTLGRLLPAPFEMRAIPNGPAREPDLLFVALEHLERLTEERLSGPADLVVEVISTDSVARDRADKFYEYQSAGVREYWILVCRVSGCRLIGSRRQNHPLSSRRWLRSSGLKNCWRP
jgi:Uma2 family endonuclease